MKRPRASQCLGRGAALAALLCVTVAVGCGERLREYPSMGGGESLRVLAQRQHALTTVEGVGTVTLTDADGRQVRLDAAMVAQMPGRIRVRGWKLGHGVLDVTCLEDGLWVWSADANGEGAGPDPQHVGRGVQAILGILSGELYERAVVTGDSSSHEIRALAHDAGEMIEIVIDRPTLTVREIRGGPESGATVRLLDYRMIGDIPWAQRVEVESPAGRIVLRLGDVQLGGEPAPGAFTPARGAVNVR